MRTAPQSATLSAKPVGAGLTCIRESATVAAIRHEALMSLAYLLSLVLVLIACGALIALMFGGRDVSRGTQSPGERRHVPRGTKRPE